MLGSDGHIFSIFTSRQLSRFTIFFPLDRYFFILLSGKQRRKIVPVLFCLFIITYETYGMYLMFCLFFIRNIDINALRYSVSCFHWALSWKFSFLFCATFSSVQYLTTTCKQTCAAPQSGSGSISRYRERIYWCFLCPAQQDWGSFTKRLVMTSVTTLALLLLKWVTDPHFRKKKKKDIWDLQML